MVVIFFTCFLVKIVVRCLVRITTKLQSDDDYTIIINIAPISCGFIGIDKQNKKQKTNSKRSCVSIDLFFIYYFVQMTMIKKKKINPMTK